MKTVIKIFKTFLPFALLLLISVKAERTKDKMYERINTTAACFRRLNATHQTGCASKRGGSVGVIHVINTENDVDFLVKNGEAGPYVIVLPVSLLTHDVLLKFTSKPNLVSGAIAHVNSTRPEHWTPENQCPNPLSSIDGSCKRDNPWNTKGSSLLHVDWPFPVFLVREEEELEKIVECFTKFNNYDYEGQPLRSLCALELDSHMLAAVDAPTCVRRSDAWTVFTKQQFCEALGDRNVWSTLLGHENETEALGAVLVVARTDTTSLFNEVMPGADSAVTGLVTLLAIARHLSRMRNETDTGDYKMNIWFMVLNGEAYDYIGSQRIIWDIKNGRFPPQPLTSLKIEDIKFVVELSQLGLSSKQLFGHHVGAMETSGIDSRFFKLLGEANLNIKDVPSRDRFPPSSIQTFLKSQPKLPHLLITDHENAYVNQYYNSIYDDSTNIAYTYHNGTPPSNSIQNRIADYSDSIARALHALITETKSPPPLPVDEYTSDFLVDELMSCYMTTASCLIHRAVGLRETPDNIPPLSLYVGTANHNNLQTTLTAGALAFLTGEKLPFKQENCHTNIALDPSHQLIWMGDGINDPETGRCYRTTMNMTPAVSPAFEIENYPWSSGEYSTWAESGWYSLSVHMFLRPSARHEIATISIGTVTLVLSMALVYFVNGRSHILFPSSPERTISSPVSS